jgi:hypothetical protein
MKVRTGTQSDTLTQRMDRRMILGPTWKAIQLEMPQPHIDGCRAFTVLSGRVRKIKERSSWRFRVPTAEFPSRARRDADYRESAYAAP